MVETPTEVRDEGRTRGERQTDKGQRGPGRPVEAGERGHRDAERGGETRTEREFRKQGGKETRTLSPHTLSSLCLCRTGGCGEGVGETGDGGGRGKV